MHIHEHCGLCSESISRMGAEFAIHTSLWAPYRNWPAYTASLGGVLLGRAIRVRATIALSFCLFYFGECIAPLYVQFIHSIAKPLNMSETGVEANRVERSVAFSVTHPKRVLLKSAQRR